MITAKRRKDSFFGIHCDYHGKPEDNKIQGQTLSEEDIRSICRTLRPDFIQIDCKGHPGWASYPSAIGNALPHFAVDTLEVWRRVTREEGVALYLHYSGIYDIKYCNEHPEECVMAADGSIIAGATRLGGRYADDILIPQFSEIIEKYQVDGFWVDGECWMAQTDFRPQTLADFEKETGIDLCGRLPATPNDPYYEEYRDYHRQLFRKYVSRYVDILHEKYPGVQIASNWAFSDHMPEPVSANVDFLSGDLNHNNSVNSARYAARALAQQGEPWDLMSWNFRIIAGQRPTMVAKHVNQILQEAASVISLGGAFQNYVAQFKDGSPNTDEINSLLPLAEFMRLREPYCFRGTPVHQSALLLSTYDRKHQASRLYSRTGYEKTLGMTALLCDIGQSLEIVCEHTLKKDIDCYKMIAVPELFFGLAEETVSDLLEYAERGGNLVLTGSKTCRIFAQRGLPIEVEELPIFVGNGNAAYENGHESNKSSQHRSYFFNTAGKDGAWGTAFIPCTLSARGAEVISEICDDIREERKPLALRIPYGKGSVTAIGFDLGSQYIEGAQYMHRELMRKAVDGLYVPLVKIESALGVLEVVPLMKDGKLMIQLTNCGGRHQDNCCTTDDLIPPVLDARISVALDGAPEALILRPEGRTLGFEYKDGRAYFDLDRLDIHSIVEVITK